MNKKRGLLLSLCAAVVLMIMLLALSSCSASSSYDTVTHTMSEEFKEISVETSTADIVLLPSEDGECAVMCYEKENMPHLVYIEDGALNIRVDDRREWYEHIIFGFESPKITVFLPEAWYSSLRIEESTGNIEISGGLRFEIIDVALSTGNVTCNGIGAGDILITGSTGNITLADTAAGSLGVSVSTGRISLSDVYCSGDIDIGVSTGEAALTDVACDTLTSAGSTGDMLLKNVRANKIDVERSTGDVCFEDSDAFEIVVETSTGDVTGSLLSGKDFDAKSDTGSTEVPKSTYEGGICRIETDTGDIRISISK